MPEKLLRLLRGNRLRPAPLPAWWPLAVLTVVIAVTLVLPDLAFARGGGGGHGGGGGGTGIGGGGGGIGGGGIGGSGGGGFGGGGGFRGGGGGGFFFLPFFFGGGGGFISLLIVIFLIWLFLRFVTSSMHRADSRWQDDRAFSQPAPILNLRPQVGDADLSAIAMADPRFDRTAFLARVEEAVTRLQQAWQDRDLAVARPYMGAGLYLSWQTQIDQLKLLHKKNLLENLEVLGTAIASAAHGSRFDHITVRVDARAADYEVDDRSGAIVFGSRSVEEFVEYWTFERTAGATTPDNGGVLEQVCPVCGAPLKINEIGDCEYCGSAITSGKFDWVLARIDQADEWEAHAAQRASANSDSTPAVAFAAAAGMQAISASDPAFDPDAFIERAEMAFFLIEGAWQQNRIETVRPYFDASLYQAWQEGSARQVANGQRQVLENLNVQGVQVVGASQGAEVDRIRIQFDAVAANQIVDAATGAYVTGQRSDQRFTEYWTFQRPAGTATPADGGVLAHKCPNCGRPLTLNEAGDCASCGAPVTNGKFDWSLVAVERPGVLNAV